MASEPIPTLDDIRRAAEECDDCAEVFEQDDEPCYSLVVTVGSLTLDITSDYKSSALFAAYGALQMVRDNDKERHDAR